MEGNSEKFGTGRYLIVTLNMYQNYNSLFTYMKYKHSLKPLGINEAKYGQTL